MRKEIKTAMKSKYIALCMLLVSNTALCATSDARRAQISEILTSIKSEQGYPGVSLAVSFKGDDYTDQIGFSDVAAAASVNEDTVFRAYSLTKGLTEILARILVINRTLDLESPISNYLPSIPSHLQLVTSHQLLSHRSGIRHYQSEDEWLRLSKQHCTSPKDAIATFIDDPLISKVGSQKHYSSFGYVLLSAVFESASDESFENLMSKYILEPSEASSTEFDKPSESSHSNRTKFYEPSNGTYVEAPNINNSCKFGGGGLNSTPREIAQVYYAYFSGSLSSETPLQVTEYLPKHFTLSGEGLGGRAALIAYPSENLTVVLMANARGGNLQPYASKIADLFLIHTEK